MQGLVHFFQRYVFRMLTLAILVVVVGVFTFLSRQAKEAATVKIDVKEIIFEHLGDAYEWHVVKGFVIPLPCILYSAEQGFDVFLSDRLEGGETYHGYHIDHESGKIVNAAGVRPIDISITKNVSELFLASFIVCAMVLGLAGWYKRHGYQSAPGGFWGMIETVICFVDQDIARASIGHEYKRFTRYLITIFFFILTCNLLGLLPVFPGGANLTGNIAVTMVCAITAWIATNFFAPKAYFKSIFWPDVPIALKAFPLIPTIEFIGVFTKPFSLTIRLFANILAGHIIILSLTVIIFIMWQQQLFLGGFMNVVSVAFILFMNCLELLVAFVQAYVFTMLTANFIGLAQNE